MNNKKNLYILLPLVLGLWGYIAFRIFVQVNPDVETLPMDKLPLLEKNEKEEKKEYLLYLNYSDPFLKMIHQEESLKNEEINTNGYQAQRTMWNWPNMSYGGCIKNKKKMVAILKINSKNLLVQEGKIYDDFLIQKVYNDSIIIVRDTLVKKVYKTN